MPNDDLELAKARVKQLEVIASSGGTIEVRRGHKWVPMYPVGSSEAGLFVVDQLRVPGPVTFVPWTSARW